jgi:predicted MFS family arabinose efflux permease
MTGARIDPTGQPGGPVSAVEAGPPRPALVSRPLALVFAASFAGLTSFYLLLSVVPKYAATSGAGGIGAGLATGALFFSTTLTELATPRLVALLGYRLVFGAGLLLLGVPALGLSASADLAAIAVICLLRGIGLAIVVVVGSALVAVLVPAERRGEGLGLYGVVVGVPSIVALPLGLWLAAQAGYRTVFVAAALAAVSGLVALPGRGTRGPQMEPAAGVLAALKAPTLLLPSIVFLSTAMAAGVVVTFVPLAVLPDLERLAAPALLLFAAASTLSRWWAGRHTDRHPAADLLRPGVLLTGLGIAGLVLVDRRLALLAATTLVGAGFGVAQNASLTLMFDAVPRSEFESVSAVWNLAYDAGLGLGGAGFGVLVTRTGYAAGFALTAALMLATLAAVWHSRHLVARTRDRAGDAGMA